MYNNFAMVRITDQYFWNVLLGIFFLLLVLMGSIILSTEARVPLSELTLVDYLLVTLATWRLVRLFAYDHSTKWLREQFYDLKPQGKGYVLERPKFGIRRTLADLIANPWTLATWLGALVVFFYLLTPYAYYFAIFLSVAAMASLLQIISLRLEGVGEKGRSDIEA